MGREVRRVAGSWKHPKGEDGSFLPLFGETFLQAWTRWEIGRRHWARGERRSFLGSGWTREDVAGPWEEWEGEEPNPCGYMPAEAFGKRFQMYEDTTEGTPISPVFSRAADLAGWLAQSGASFFGNMETTEAHWLAVIKGETHGCAVFVQKAQPATE